jgi:hypothetical protein
VHRILLLITTREPEPIAIGAGVVSKSASPISPRLLESCQLLRIFRFALIVERAALDSVVPIAFEIVLTVTSGNFHDATADTIHYDTIANHKIEVGTSSHFLVTSG